MFLPIEVSLRAVGKELYTAFDFNVFSTMHDDIYISYLVVCFSTVSFVAKESLSHTKIGLLKGFNSNFAFIRASLSPAPSPG